MYELYKSLRNTRMFYNSIRIIYLIQIALHETREVLFMFT